MKYISDNGHIIEFKRSTIASRTISFMLKNSSKFNTESLLNCISKHCYGLISEIRFKNRYKDKGNNIFHSYDIQFEIPYFLVINSREKINEIISLIEMDLIKQEIAIFDVNNKRNCSHVRNYTKDVYKLKQDIETWITGADKNDRTN